MAPIGFHVTMRLADDRVIAPSAVARRRVARLVRHHGVAHDPRHDGSVLPDLLGLRVGGREIVGRGREHLPRVTREDLLGHLGVATLEASGGVAVGPEASTAGLGEALGVSSRSVQRARKLSAPPAHVRAVRLQLALGAALASSGAFGAVAGEALNAERMRAPGR